MALRDHGQSSRSKIGRLIVLSLALLVSACASSRQGTGPEAARAAGWEWNVLTARMFDLATATPPSRTGKTLRVYLEGDGLAYVTPSKPAIDPTPTDPVALKLALADPTAGPVAWLGRPCQYTLPAHGRTCRTAYWTTSRYAPEVTDSLSAALDQLKQQSHAERLILTGYSGGGALAVLLAARRDDVAQVITVAADLDLGYWTHRDGLSPLSGSLDPAQLPPETLARIPQLHFTGAKDRTVGTDVVQSYLKRLPPETPARLVEVPDFTHTCCWARDWADLLSRN